MATGKDKKLQIKVGIKPDFDENSRRDFEHQLNDIEIPPKNIEIGILKDKLRKSLKEAVRYAVSGFPDGKGLPPVRIKTDLGLKDQTDKFAADLDAAITKSMSSYLKKYERALSDSQKKLDAVTAEAADTSGSSKQIKKSVAHTVAAKDTKVSSAETDKLKKEIDEVKREIDGIPESYKKAQSAELNFTSSLNNIYNAFVSLKTSAQEYKDVVSAINSEHLKVPDVEHTKKSSPVKTAKKDININVDTGDIKNLNDADEAIRRLYVDSGHLNDNLGKSTSAFIHADTAADAYNETLGEISEKTKEISTIKINAENDPTTKNGRKKAPAVSAGDDAGQEKRMLVKIQALQDLYNKIGALSETKGSDLSFDIDKLDQADLDSISDRQKQINDEIEALTSKRGVIFDQDLSSTRSYVDQLEREYKRLHNLQFGGYQQSDAGAIQSKFDAITSKMRGTIDTASHIIPDFDSKKYLDQIEALEFAKSALVDNNGNVINSNLETKRAFDTLCVSIEEASKDLANYASRRKQYDSAIASIEKDIINYGAPGRTSNPGIDALIGQYRKLQSQSKVTSSSMNETISIRDKLNNAMRSSSEADRSAKSVLQLNTNMKNLNSQVLRYIESNTKIASNKRLFDNFKQLSKEIEDGSIKYDRAKNAFSELRQETIALGLESQTLGFTLKKLFKDHFNTAIVMGGLNLIRQGFSQIFIEVRNVDTAMTELKKVTNATSAQYDAFLTNAASRARDLGAALSDIVTATADFARLGYSMEQASGLADAASIYKNVGDGIQDISEASESIISTMKAFGIEAGNAMSIVDKFNEVGNNFAISSSGVGEAMRRSAAALAAAGNSIDESIALVTVGNEIIQDPDVVGNAMKVASMRLRGLKVELEEAGESTDGMAETVSDLRKKLLALSDGKVDIMKNDNEFKSTIDIFKELSVAYKEMTDAEQAATLELVAGKRQGNIIAGILENADALDKVAETSANSLGSATKENERYLDSINGKINQLVATFQEFSSTVLDSEFVKGTIDAGTGILGFLNSVVETLDAIPALVATAAASLSAIKNIG